MGLYLSFTKFSTLTNARFVGTDNYARAKAPQVHRDDRDDRDDSGEEESLRKSLRSPRALRSCQCPRNRALVRVLNLVKER